MFLKGFPKSKISQVMHNPQIRRAEMFICKFLNNFCDKAASLKL